MKTTATANHARIMAPGGAHVAAGHARPVALRPHNVVKANTALNDTLTDGRRMHRPYGNRVIPPAGNPPCANHTNAVSLHILFASYVVVRR